jgi:hypothetical protein
MPSRPEITGRRIFATSEPSKTILEFCQAERISRSKYYGMKKNGTAPEETRVDGVIRITPESHARWRHRHTARTRAAGPRRPAGKITAGKTIAPTS